MASTRTKDAGNGKVKLDPQDIAEAAQEYLEAAAEAARDRSHKATRKAVHAADDGVELIRAGHGELESMVRRNPTASLAGALGVGLLVGLALKSRR